MSIDPIPAPRAGEFPPIFGYHHLSQLLGRSVSTLQADRCRHADSLPPACTPPGTKSPRWILADVLAWLKQYEQAPGVKKPRALIPGQRGPGRPTKAEQIARREQEGGAA